MKLFEILLARYLKSQRRVRIGKILTFSINEKVCSKLEDRFGMITGRNIRGMSFSSWMATLLFVSRLSIFDNTRTSRVKPEIFSFSIR